MTELNAIPPRVKHIVNVIMHGVEWLGLVVVTMATVVAFIVHIGVMLTAQTVKLHDLLLLFIYIEIITMVALYVNTGKLPLRYPIYIAIVAIARYIIIDMKSLASWEIVALCLAIFVLTVSALLIRYGHTQMPYKDQSKEET